MRTLVTMAKLTSKIIFGKKQWRHFAAGILALFCVVGLSVFSFAGLENTSAEGLYENEPNAGGELDNDLENFISIDTEDVDKIAEITTALTDKAGSYEQSYVFSETEYRLLKLATATDLVSRVYLHDQELHLSEDELIAAVVLPSESASFKLSIKYLPSDEWAGIAFKAPSGDLIGFDRLSDASIDKNADGSYLFSAELNAGDLSAISFYAQPEYGMSAFQIVGDSSSAEEGGAVAVSDIQVLSLEFGDLNGGYGVARKMTAVDEFYENIAEFDILTADGAADLVDIAFSGAELSIFASDPAAISVNFVSDDLTLIIEQNTEDLDVLLAVQLSEGTEEDITDESADEEEETADAAAKPGELSKSETESVNTSELDGKPEAADIAAKPGKASEADAKKADAVKPAEEAAKPSEGNLQPSEAPDLTAKPEGISSETRSPQTQPENTEVLSGAQDLSN